jgi:hypothetical protein
MPKPILNLGDVGRRICGERDKLSSSSSFTDGALFQPVKNNRTGRLDRPLDPASIYRNIVLKYGLETGITVHVKGLCVHSLRATAATNALSNDADIAKVQDASTGLKMLSEQWRPPR